MARERPMISIYALKPRFQGLLRPLATRLQLIGVTANQVTLTACVISVALGIFVYLDAAQIRSFLLIPVWMFLRMALNAIDGMLAREFGQRSALGAYLNELTDVVADAALYLPFAALPQFDAGWIIAVIGLAIISEYAGVLGLMVGASRRYDGPMGKSDRAFCFGAIAFAVGLGVPQWDWLHGIPMVISLLLLLTVWNRVRRGLAEASTRVNQP